MPAESQSAECVAKYADMFSAMGTEARLRIMQLLLKAHPDGLVVSEIQEKTGNSQLHAFPSSRQTEKRGAGCRAAQGHFPALYSQH